MTDMDKSQQNPNFYLSILLNFNYKNIYLLFFRLLPNLSYKNFVFISNNSELFLLFYCIYSNILLYQRQNYYLNVIN